MHPAWYSSAGPGRERQWLGIFEVMSHLVEERVEQLFQGTWPELAVFRVNANQPAVLVVAPQNPGGRSVVDVKLVVDPAPVDSLEAVAEQGPDRRGGEGEPAVLGSGWSRREGLRSLDVADFGTRDEEVSIGSNCPTSGLLLSLFVHVC